MKYKLEIISIIMKTISLLSFVIFLTFFVMFLIYLKSSNLFLHSFIILNFLIWLILTIIWWHLYFDSKLFFYLWKNQESTYYIDNLIESIFAKKIIQNRTIDDRIKWSIKLTKKFIYIFIFHIIIFIIIILYFLLLMFFN